MSNVKKLPDHMNRAHAKLSASGSSRWLNCPGSVKAEVGYKNTSSIYAEEGTFAHELGDICLSRGEDAEIYIGKTIDKSGTKVEADMARFVQEYLDYVRSFETSDSILYTEERVDFSNYIPGGFGTMDAGILIPSERLCHIFDLKYGRGIEVSPVENTQGMLYAVGLLNELDWLGDIDKFVIHIAQPRTYNMVSWEISVKDLIKFAEWAQKQADLALTDDAPRVAGEKQCSWCKDKANCETLFKYTEKIISCEFDNLEELDMGKLSNDQKRSVLDNRKLITNFLKAVEAYAFESLENGEEFAGYKLVEGRSVRQYIGEAESVLKQELGEEAYTKKILGITAAEKLVGKDIMSTITTKPPGKLTLAPESDKRKAVEVSPVVDEFDDLEE